MPEVMGGVKAGNVLYFPRDMQRATNPQRAQARKRHITMCLAEKKEASIFPQGGTYDLFTGISWSSSPAFRPSQPQPGS